MPRRHAMILLTLVIAMPAAAKDVDVWIGTHQTRGETAAGIYHLTLNDQIGKLSRATLAAAQEGAGFLTHHPTRPSVLYSTGNGVTAWRIVRGGAAPVLEMINSQPTGAGGACHVAVDQTGHVLLSAQYGGGSVASYRLNNDGSIAERVTALGHDASSNVDPTRQEAPHPHWVGLSPDNRFVIVPDLGADRVYVHKLDATTGELAQHGSVETPPGGGPRHFKFHPTLPIGYVVNELSVSLSVFDWNADAGELALRQTIPTLSEAQKSAEKTSSGAEVRVHPSGKFVYAANRGHDSITAFAVDQATGELSLIEKEPIRGSWPRNFNVTPSGKWLLAAGRDSDTLAVFAIDPGTGSLQYTLEMAHAPAPICVLFE